MKENKLRLFKNGALLWVTLTQQAFLFWKTQNSLIQNDDTISPFNISETYTVTISTVYYGKGVNAPLNCTPQTYYNCAATVTFDSNNTQTYTFTPIT